MTLSHLPVPWGYGALEEKLKTFAENLIQNFASGSHYSFKFKAAEESERQLIHTWLKQDYIREWV